MATDTGTATGVQARGGPDHGGTSKLPNIKTQHGNKVKPAQICSYLPSQPQRVVIFRRFLGVVQISVCLHWWEWSRDALVGQRG